MPWLHSILILAAAFLVVYLEVTLNELRLVLRAPLDLLPGLVAYTSLSCGILPLAALAVVGGLLHDSLSANPLGISILPMFVVGFVIQRYQGLILRDEAFAQWMVGLACSGLIPVLTLVLLFNSDKKPVLGWFSLWQWLLGSVIGALLTPLWFLLFRRVLQALSYQPFGQTSFRPDREIKRGRM